MEKVQAYYGPRDLPELPLPAPGVFPYTRGTGEIGDFEGPEDPIPFSGYELRERGATAVQEIAFVFCEAIEYAERAGAIDTVAPRFVFTFSAGDNFFEEIAKYRAARALWATIMRDRLGAKDERSLKLRFHVRTASCALTRGQPYNNVIRTALHAMAAVLGGARSVDVQSALRIAETIEYESGIAAVPDPFGGSYYLERLTADIKVAVRDYMAHIHQIGRSNAESEIVRAPEESRHRVEL